MIHRLYCSYWIFIVSFIFDCGFLLIEAQEIGSNCTKEDLAAIDQCKAFDPTIAISNVTFTNGNLLFTDPNQLDSLDRICQSFHRYTQCTSNFNPSARKCLASMIDVEKTNSFGDYVCLIVLPMAKDNSTTDCWNRSKQCKLIPTQIASGSNAVGSSTGSEPGVCSILSVVDLQLNCALDQQPVCQYPRQEVLREARSDTSSFMDSFHCLDVNQTRPAGGVNINAPTQLPTSSEEVIQQAVVPNLGSANNVNEQQNVSNVPAAVPTTFIVNCTEDQNNGARICLSELWGIQQYFESLKGGKFFTFLLSNETVWRNICGQVSSYKQCLSKIVPNNQVNSRCTFRTQMHNLANMLRIFCEDESALNVRENCAINDQENQQCSSNADAVVNNFASVQSGNNQQALCDSYGSTRSYFSCSQKALVNCQNDVAKLDHVLQQNAKSDGCNVEQTQAHPQPNILLPTGGVTALSNVSESGEESEESPMTSAPQKPQIEPMATTANSISCSSVSEDDCEDFSYDPLTVLYSNAISSKFCQERQPFLTCSSCNYLNYTDGLKNLIEFICGPGNETYQESIQCLREVRETDQVKACVEHFLLFDLPSNDYKCPAINRMLNCSYPAVVQNCKQDTVKFHINTMHNFAYSLEGNCVLEIPGAVSISQPNLTSVSPLIEYYGCSHDETDRLEQCSQPFKQMFAQMLNMQSKGITAIITGLKKVGALLRQACGYKEGFHTCVSKSLTSDSTCKMNSCILTGGDATCASNDTGSSVENKVKCMFGLFSEPKFQECLNIFPKEATTFEAIKPYLPVLVECLKELLTKKCGEESYRLVKMLVSKPGPNNTECMLNLSGTAVPGEIQGQPSTPIVVPLIPQVPVPTGVVPVAQTSVVPPLMEENITSAVTEGELRNVTHIQLAIEPVATDLTTCTTERLDQFTDCSNVLGDYKPSPIALLDDPTKLDRACSLYKDYQMCLKQYGCIYPLGEAYKDLLYNVCTIYYDKFKANQLCLRRASYSAKVQLCINTYQATDLRSIKPDYSEKSCKAVTQLLKCAGDTVDFNCGTDGLDLLYTLYQSFSQKLSPGCTPTRTDIGPPKKECLKQDRDIYYGCRKDVAINPISFVNTTEEFGQFCQRFGSTFQTCVNKAPCLPEPAHQAFNDTLSYLCFTDNRKADFKLYGECLTKVAQSPDGQRCIQPFNNIIWDENGRSVCRKLNAVLDCGYPLINKNCHEDTIILIYDVFSLMAMRYRTNCLLNVPPQVAKKGMFTNFTAGPVPSFASISSTQVVNIITTTAGTDSMFQMGAIFKCLALFVVTFIMKTIF